jgi:hypothetical protein
MNKFIEKHTFLYVMLMVLTAICLGASVMYSLQQPPTTFPDHDVAYVCNPTDAAGAPVTFKFTPIPSPHFDVFVGNNPALSDTIDPVITSVTNSANVDITTGAVKLVAATAGLAMTVTASDNVGVVSGKLEVDGRLATPFGNSIDVLPPSFYVRWNSTTIAAGIHTMRLSVCDAAKHCAVRTWSMTK